MQTKQAIQATANVIRVTQISPGDVYKRFEEGYEDRVYFGIVKNVHNDGERALIEATEYRYQYGSLDVSYKVLQGDKNYILFPSSPEEMNLQLETAKANKLKEISEAETKIQINKKMIIEIDGLISGETQKNLQAMSFVELSQELYNEKKLALG